MAEAPSLAARVLRGMLLILLAGGLLVAASTWINGRAAARQSYDRLLLGAANDIAESIRVLDGQPVVDLPVSAFELLAQAPDDRIHYAVRGPGGQLLTGMGASVEPDAPTRGTVYFDAAMQGEAARFVRVTRLFAEREFSGEVSVVVGQTLRARQTMAVGLMLDALAPMALAGLALLGMAWLVTRSAVRPLEALSGGLSARDPYDLTPMPTEGLPRELRVMVASVNHFMGRLDRQVNAMRNLISDTAHQLRTPVAAIRVQAEGLQEEASPRGLERLLGRTRSLGVLLDQLLSRALVTHRADSAPRVALDLREVALDIVDARDHELLAPGVEVRLEIGEDPVMVHAEEFSVGEAAKNLLSNALKHGVPPVAIGVDTRGAEAWLWVQDSGPGPDAAIAARLGERFARSTASREDSAGLGLSIVRDVAAAYGGRMEMERLGCGFRMALVLPEVLPEVSQ
ncbi:sensor histidine kinase [Sagittula sp. S175]|uniref:sensor histidine kinase n=1 Tax=Sagittula sp. S175 TaxID=3415129 RepID=UPI003C7CDB59